MAAVSPPEKRLRFSNGMDAEATFTMGFSHFEKKVEKRE
jgi:hypothetical protein